MKKPKVIFCAVLVAALLQCVGAMADATLNSDASGKAITSYWETDEYKNQIADAVSRIPQSIYNRCDALKTSNVAVFILSKFIADDDGKLKAAVWKESYAFSGCGNDSSLNFIFLVNNQGKIVVITALPGESRSSVVLQHDTLANVFASLNIHTKTQCDNVIVINTLVGKIENKRLVRVDPNTVQAKTIWNEVWTADACGKKLLVPIEFIPDAITKPDATGTTFVVHASDILDQ
jgi:hypothetical protein